MRLLLSKCQEEFETRSKASSAFDKKDADLSPDEKHAKLVAKRKMLGNIKFIGMLLEIVIFHYHSSLSLSKHSVIPNLHKTNKQAGTLYRYQRE